jgi:branched-chain amino acid transport system permease protein
LLNAVRDNPERVEFIGYNPHRVRYSAFIIAGFFAGISGGLGALNFEIVNAEVVGAARSGGYLLFTFLGGATFFFGPIVGAILMVLAFVLLSELTKAWLLYLGAVFMLMVMYAPGGIASLVMRNLQLARHGLLRPMLGAYGLLGLASGLCALGVSALIEMVYHRQLNAAMGAQLRFLGSMIDTASPLHWCTLGAALLLAAAFFEWARKRFAVQWDAAQQAIEQARLQHAGEAP